MPYVKHDFIPQIASWMKLLHELDIPCNVAGLSILRPHEENMELVVVPQSADLDRAWSIYTQLLKELGVTAQICLPKKVKADISQGPGALVVSEERTTKNGSYARWMARPFTHEGDGLIYLTANENATLRERLWFEIWHLHYLGQRYLDVVRATASECHATKCIGTRKSVSTIPILIVNLEPGLATLELGMA